MSNKAQLHTTNTKVASLIETLRGKSAGSEDVTAETNAYTEKITQLETAVTALETELAGKASGGSGGARLEPYTVSITFNKTVPDANSLLVYYGRCDGSLGSVGMGAETVTISDANGLLIVAGLLSTIHTGGSIDPIWANHYEVCVYNITSDGTIIVGD